MKKNLNVHVEISKDYIFKEINIISLFIIIKIIILKRYFYDNNYFYQKR